MSVKSTVKQLLFPISMIICPDVLAEPVISELETIVVTATKTEKSLLETPASVTLQDVAKLRQKGFTYGTDEFRGVPGVFFRRGEGDGEEFPFITIRGITGNHGNDTFLSMIDGIPFVGPDEEVLLFEVPYPIVEQVEIVRGPVSALYGRGALAGAVNYRTRAPIQDATEVSLSAGEDGYYRGQILAERVLDNEVSLLASLSYEDFDGWRSNSARDTTSAFIKGIFPIADDVTVSAWLTFFERNGEVPSVIPALADGTVIDVVDGVESFLGQRPTRNDNTGWIGALRYDRQLTDSVNIQGTFQARSFDSDVRLNFYDFFEFDPDNSVMGVNGFASDNDATVLFADASVGWKIGSHNLLFGFSAERATLDEEDRWTGEIDPFFTGECGFRFYAILIDYSTAQVLNDQPDNTCFVREQLRTAADTTNTFYGFFVQNEISLTEQLTLTLGGRYDKFDRDIDFSVVGTLPTDQSADGDADAFAPKASLSYRYSNGQIYTSYGRGFNSNFGPIFQWEPDRFARDEEPTTIDSFEFGWKGHNENKTVSWEAAVFYLEQEDRRIFVSNPDPTGPPTLATTGQEYSSSGFEGAIRLQIAKASSISMSYTFLDPEWDELILQGSFGAPDTDFSGNTPQGVPENMFYADVEHQFTPWLVGRASYEWYDDYEVDLSNSVSDGQYDLLNLSATISPASLNGTAIDVSLTNALDEEYFFFFAGSRTAVTNVSPGVPRQFRVTVRSSF